MMQNNLQVYYTVLKQIDHWLPQERVTRRRNLALLVVGLYLGASVNLARIVRHWPQPGQLVSLTNRLRRFLSNKRVSPQGLYEPFVRCLLASRAGQPVRLIIDTTQVGRYHRALVVALAYRRRAIPLAWSIHPHHSGNTKVVEQTALLAYLYGHMPSDASVSLVGDSAFRTGDLFLWLQRRGWQFVIRQRKEVYIRTAHTPWQPISDIPLAKGETKVVGPVWMGKTNPVADVWLVLHWGRGESVPWILVTDQGRARIALRRYRRRMWIEAMFGDMKANGFDLNYTRLRDVRRLERLLLGVCLAYIWLIAVGSWVVKNGQRPLLDRRERRDKSYFRLGWDWLALCLSRGDPLHWRSIPYFSK
jgi:hypothetical protein